MDEKTKCAEIAGTGDFLVLELPIPLPTWNRILAMHHWERKKLRDLIHEITRRAVSGERSNEIMIQQYLKLIRPKKGRTGRLRGQAR